MNRLTALAFLLLCSTAPCNGAERKTFTIPAVTAGMVKLHLGMTQAEVEQTVGPAYLLDGGFVGEKGPGVHVWQVQPEDHEKPKDGASLMKFLVARLVDGKVTELKTVKMSAMIGVGR